MKNKITKSIFIKSSKENVWDIMLNKETYKIWTKHFNPTSYFEGDWSEGSKMLFLGTDENGKKGGMVSRVAKNIPYKYISIEHLGIVENYIEDTISEKAKSWAPSFENYTLTEKDNGIELLIDIDIQDEYKEMFEEMWDNALLELKNIIEK